MFAKIQLIGTYHPATIARIKEEVISILTWDNEKFDEDKFNDYYHNAIDEGVDGKLCPKCNTRYLGYPAISRRDNKTEICSDCGTLEALDDFADNLARNARKKKQSKSS